VNTTLPLCMYVLTDAPCVGKHQCYVLHRYFVCAAEVDGAKQGHVDVWLLRGHSAPVVLHSKWSYLSPQSKATSLAIAATPLSRIIQRLGLSRREFLRIQLVGSHA
jgi:hypothetical protein